MTHLRRSLPRKNARVLHVPVPLSKPGVPKVTDGPAPMRALTLIYHEDFEVEITAVIKRCMAVARYTKIRDVVGARTDEIQEMDYAQNGKNNMLIIVATQEVIFELSQQLRELRQVKGHGLRGYVTPVEGLI